MNQSERLNKARELLAAKELGRAEAAVREALAKDPGNSEALDILGQIAIRAGDVQAAAGLFQKALGANPKEAAHAANLAQALHDIGNTSGAIEVVDFAIGNDPADAFPWIMKGTFLLALGRSEEAVAALNEAAGIDPGDGDAYRLLGLLGALKPGSPQHEAAKLLAEDGAAEASHRAGAQYGLAASSLDEGDDESFMGHIDAANALQHGEPGSTAKMESKLFDDLIDRAPEPGENPSPAPESSPLTPIFVLGMPRSGTSLVEPMLASHPEVEGCGELVLVRRGIAHQIKQISGLDFAAGLSKLTNGQRREISAFLTDRLARLAAGKRFVVDKNPWNFQMIGAIQAILPEARIVHVARDPLDTCFSIYTNYFAANHSQFTEQGALGRYYREYERLMRFWRGKYPGLIHHIQYEALVGNFEAEARALLEFCGLEWSESVLEIHKTQRPVRTLSAGDVRQPISTKSIGRAGKSRKYLGPLIESLGDLARPGG
ncbi:MAG: sulfotransferase [Sphingomonadales bacterium]